MAAGLPSDRLLTPAEAITKLARLQEKFRRDAGAPGVIAAHAHVERVEVEPTPRLFT